MPLAVATLVTTSLVVVQEARVANGATLHFCIVVHGSSYLKSVACTATSGVHRETVSSLPAGYQTRSWPRDSGGDPRESPKMEQIWEIFLKRPAFATMYVKGQTELQILCGVTLKDQMLGVVLFVPAPEGSTELLRCWAHVKSS